MNTRMNTWSSNLFDCFNIETLAACCCLPFTTLTTAHEQHNNPKLSTSTCCILSTPIVLYNFYPQIAIVSYNILMTTVISATRHTVREQEGIISDQTCTDPFYDVIVTAVCPHLSLAQTMRQQKHSKEQIYKIINDDEPPKKQEMDRKIKIDATQISSAVVVLHPNPKIEYTPVATNSV